VRNTSASKLPVRKLPARKLLGTVIAATLFIPTSGFTLGLGEIEVNSALNQKLSADIELLSTTVEDTENIIIKLASRKAFTRAGLDRPYALNDLRFKAEIINGVPHIKVSSSSPIREPFLNFLVEVDWPNGHLLREYTVLLDPPVFMTQAVRAPTQQATTDSRPTSGTIYSTPVAPATAAPTYQYQAPAPVVQQPVKQPRVQAAPAVRQPAVRQPVVQQPVQPQVIQQQVQAVWNPPVASEYKVKKGDTAWGLAESMRPDQSISVEQMMVAMLRHNPESFIDGNINGLRRGYVLRVPDYDQIASVNKRSARALVQKQAALWRQYQQVKAGGQLASAMEKGTGGSADSPAAMSFATKKDDAHLAIVSAGTGVSTASSKDPTKMTAKELRAELALARERIETERVEKEGLQQKVSQLEASTQKMKGMLSIEDDQLSNVQALNLPADAAKVETKLDDTLTELKEATETAKDAAESATDDVMAKADEMADSLTETKPDVEATENEGDALFVDETTQEGSTQEGAENAAVAPINESSDAAQPQPTSSNSQSWLDTMVAKLTGNPTLAAAAGGGLLLLLGLFGWMFKRGKSEADDVAVTSGFDGLDDLADEVAEEQKAELQSAEDDDASDPDVTTSMDAFDETEAGETTTDDATSDNDEEASDEEEPRDDVIAEADVYLAYGIYQQAEELLTQAIEDNPDRNDYRLKLAETHYASKSADAYVEIATDIKDKVKEDSAIWKKVLVMGQDLCSDNVMFQGSLIGGLDLDSITPQAPEMDLDLDLDAASNDEVEAIDENTELELPEVESLADLDDTADDKTVDEIGEAEELEFDLSDADATEQSESTDDAEFSLDIDASELDIATEVEDSETDIDFGLEEVSEVVDDAEDEISLDLTAEADVLNIVPNADVEASLDDNADEVEDEVSLDLTDVADSFNLDLDDDANDSIEIISDNEADDDDFDLSSLDDVDEISTKLDLARAYLDMGDKEGTRSILEEVVAEGNDDQKHEANSLMAKLG